jgi:hypothetical protein
MHRVRDNLTYSNVLSTLCLALLLGGGTAYAATTLGRESVGTRQLKKEAVTPAKLSKGVQEDLAAASAKPDSSRATLGSGETLRGTYDLHGSEGQLDGAVTFQVALPATTEAHFPASADPTDCPGTAAEPQARPGNFCVYDRLTVNSTPSGAFAPEVADNGRAGRFGAVIVLINQGNKEAHSYGSWAVTAP